MENNKFLNVIGMMSGTSIDGIDVSHLITDGLSTLKKKEHFFINIQTTFDMLSKSIFKYNEIRNDEAFINHLNKIVTLEHINALKAFFLWIIVTSLGFMDRLFFIIQRINSHYNLVIQNCYLTILKKMLRIT